jgi:hypothetical protein
METYCNGCLHRRRNICEQPGRIEKFGRTALRVITKTAELFSNEWAGIPTGIEMQLEENEPVAQKEAETDHVQVRVAACIRLHKEMDFAEIMGAD